MPRIKYISWYTFIIIREGKQVYGEKMVGVILGVEVGNEFQYEQELNIIRLNFYLSGRIDYINIEDLDISTNIIQTKGTLT